jgi:hypothetical protein
MVSQYSSCLEHSKNKSKHERKTDFINSGLCPSGGCHSKTIHRKANFGNDMSENIHESSGLGGSKK